MEKHFKEEIKNIVWALRKIVSIIYHDSRCMVKRYNVTNPQILVLKSINNSDVPLSSADISRLINVTPANLTGIIDRLEEKKLVIRDRKADDRRVIIIKLTKKGKELVEKLPDLIEEKLIKGLYNLESSQIDNIYENLNQIIKVINIDEDTIYVDDDLI